MRGRETASNGLALIVVGIFLFVVWKIGLALPW